MLSRLTYFHIHLPSLNLVLSRLIYFHICLPNPNVVLSRLTCFHIHSGCPFFCREIWEAIFLTEKRHYMPSAEGARQGAKIEIFNFGSNYFHTLG